MTSLMKYDLEDRTERFAANCRNLIRKTKPSLSNADDLKQLLRSSGSVAANYIEANESLSKKDFRYRVKICKKEAKESRLWLRLVYISEPQSAKMRDHLIDECGQLIKIFASIIAKTG